MLFRCISPARLPLVLSRVLDLLVPASCVACGAPPAHAADVLCPGCRGALPWLRGPMCRRCALPAHRPGARCPSPTGAPAWSWAPLAHAGPAAVLVHALKHRGVLRAAAPMAAAIAANAPAGIFTSDAVLVPVPADPLRRRTRGHDHALRRTEELARRTGLPVRACLRRPRSARPQVGASRAARLARARAGVEVRWLPSERRLVLVDDVHTTGATLAAAAQALRRSADPRVEPHICAVSYGRTLSRP